MTDTSAPQAFFVVGRREWGKSNTLKALKESLNGNNKSRKPVLIGSVTFRIWEMSNDDIWGRWIDVLARLDPIRIRKAILTACPTERAIEPLNDLRRRGFELFFWLICERCDGNGERLTPEEEARFRDIGTVAFCDQPAEPPQRAEQFRRFVGSHIR